jgi:hypothetical protein
MVTISITAEAYEAVKARLPRGDVAATPQIDYSDVILRLAKG